MTKSNRSALYLLYQNGDIPNASNFQDLIDTPLWISASGQTALEGSASFQAGNGVTLTQTGSVIRIDAAGNVSGPASSIDNAVVRWNGTTGASIKNTTGASISDFGDLTISNSAPRLILEDTDGTGMITIADAGYGQLRSSAAATFTNFSIDLANSTVGLAAIPLPNVRLNVGGTLTSPDNSFGMYMGGLTLSPATGFSGFFAYFGGGAIAAGLPIAAAYGFYVESISKTGSGLLTDTYSIYAKKSTSGSNNYGAYIEGPTGIGTGPTTAINLYVQASAVDAEVQRLEAIATNTDPSERTFMAKALSVSASIAVDVATIAMPASTVYGIETKFAIRRTGGTAGSADQGGFFGKVAAFKNVGGNASRIGTTQDLFPDITDQAWSVSMIASGTNILIKLTGTANNNISAGGTYRIYGMGT